MLRPFGPACHEHPSGKERGDDRHGGNWLESPGILQFRCFTQCRSERPVRHRPEEQVRSVPAAVPVPENFSDISGCRGIPDSLSASISFCIEIARNSLDVVDMVSLLG